MKLLIISVLVIMFYIPLSSVELKMMDEVMLKAGKGDDFIKSSSSFAVTGDGLYLVLDKKDCDIKVFDVKGRFMKRIGAKGYGPNEFVQPFSCDYFDRRFVVTDLKKRQYTLLIRDKDSIVKESKLLRPTYMGNDAVVMRNEKILLSGFKADKDQTEWAFFTYDFKTGHYDYLLNRAAKFGLDSASAYRRASEDLRVIGTIGLCNWWGDYAYLAWAGDLKVFRINMKTKETRTFGKKTSHYRQPVVTDKWRKALKAVDLKAYGREAQKYAVLMGLHTNKNYLLLTYMRPLLEGESGGSMMLQFYTLEGTFINETILSKGQGCRTFLSKDRDDDILYRYKLIRTKDDDGEIDDQYQITRFKMVK